MTTIPIFLISLPRSGSTFLQKILMSHPEIASTAEPWFLLPLCYMRKKDIGYSKYGHPQVVNAFSRISEECGVEFIDTQICNFISSIYSRYCQTNEKYFLDKTPRYYFILNELVKLYPGAKFIILLRNPIAVFSSAINAFRDNSMKRIDYLDYDFNSGPERIAQFIHDYPNNIFTLTYEQLIIEPEKYVQEICDYLELDYLNTMIQNSFKIKLNGHGDKLGAQKYKKIENLKDKWRNVIDTRYRKKYLSKYIRGYSERYLKAGGYDRKKLLNEIENHKPHSFRFKEYLYWIEENVARIYKKPRGNYYGKRI